MSINNFPEYASAATTNTPIGTLRATRTRWWQRLLVAMLVVGLVGLPSARVEAQNASRPSGLDSALSVAGTAAGAVSALSSAGTLLLGASSPIMAALTPIMPYVAAVALVVALFNLLRCMFGKQKCSAATIAMAALSVGLAGANFAVQMNQSSWFGTGEFMGLGTPRAELLPQQIAAAQAAGDTTRAATLTAELQTLRPGATVLNGTNGPIVATPLPPATPNDASALTGMWEGSSPNNIGNLAPTTATPGVTAPAQATQVTRGVTGAVTRAPTVTAASSVPAQPSTMQTIMQYAPLASLGLGLVSQLGGLGGSGSSGSSQSSANAAAEQERRNREAAAAQEEANRRSAEAQRLENERMAAETKAEQERVVAEIARQQEEARKETERLAAEAKAERDRIAAETAKRAEESKTEQDRLRAEDLARASATTPGTVEVVDPVTGATVTELELNQNVFKGGCEDGARARVGNTARPNVRYANTDSTKAQYDTGFRAGMAGQACE
jgi:hypothetical protein